MGSWLLPAAALVLAQGASAAAVRNINTIEYQYQDQQLQSRNPKVKRPDHLNIMSGRSLFLYEQSKLNSQAELGATSGNSGTTSYTALQARTAATLRSAHSSDSLEGSWLRTHGADDTQRPLEETVVGDGAPFTGTRLGFRHDQTLSAINSLALGAAISRNIDGTTDLVSRDLSGAWAHRVDPNWTNTLTLLRGTQQPRQGARAENWELRNDDLWTLNSNWSAQTSIGGVQQAVDGSRSRNIILGTAVAYIIRSSQPDAKTEKAEPIKEDMIRRPDLDRIENLRTQSQVRAGYERNFDQRRRGDAQFLADQIFVQGLWVVDPEQNLQIDLQRSQAVDKTVPGAAGLNTYLANLDYRWNMPLAGPGAGLNGSFGLGITQETVKQNPRRFDRQLLRLSYAVSF